MNVLKRNRWFHRKNGNSYPAQQNEQTMIVLTFKTFLESWNKTSRRFASICSYFSCTRAREVLFLGVTSSKYSQWGNSGEKRKTIKRHVSPTDISLSFVAEFALCCHFCFFRMELTRIWMNLWFPLLFYALTTKISFHIRHKSISMNTPRRALRKKIFHRKHEEKNFSDWPWNFFFLCANDRNAIFLTYFELCFSHLLILP